MTSPWLVLHPHVHGWGATGMCGRAECLVGRGLRVGTATVELYSRARKRRLQRLDRELTALCGRRTRPPGERPSSDVDVLDLASLPDF